MLLCSNEPKKAVDFRGKLELSMQLVSDKLEKRREEGSKVSSLKGCAERQAKNGM